MSNKYAITCYNAINVLEVGIEVLVSERVEGKSVAGLGVVSRQAGQVKISVVIPMYDEEKTILPVIAKIPRLPNLEIIVVDDGSRDGSREVVRQCPGVTLINHKLNKGYGQTLIDGIGHARGDIIVTCDADGQHDPLDIPALLLPILERRADLVIGSRYMGHYTYELPLTSRAGEAFIELVLKIFFGCKVQANQSGFRAFRKAVAMDIYGHGHFSGFAFATETLLRAKLAKLRIEEAPIHLHDRKDGRSRVKLVRLLVSLLSCLGFYAIKKHCGDKVFQDMVDLAKHLPFLNLRR